MRQIADVMVAMFGEMETRVQIRKPDTGDFVAWSALYAGYAAFYGVNQTEEMRARVWSWITDPDHQVQGLIAENADVLVGLVHFRPFARPLSASTGGYLDDLFVDPNARGSGVAAALIKAVEAEGRRHGWSVIRWITAEDNRRARVLYDKMADMTKWVTYDIRL